MTDGKKQKRAAREERLRAALRENLKRRKAQAKARGSAKSVVERASEAHDSAGIVEEKQDR